MGHDNKERNRKLVENFTSKALEANIAARTAAEEREKQQEASLMMTSFNKQGSGGAMGDDGEEGVDPASQLAAEDQGKIVFTPTHEFSSRLEISLSDRRADVNVLVVSPLPLHFCFLLMLLLFCVI